MGIRRVVIALFASLAVFPALGQDGEIALPEVDSLSRTAQVEALPEGRFNPNPRLADIAGVWNGDKGIASVSLRPDGRGFALLSSGSRMMLKAVVSGPYVIVSQDQPNSPDFYRPDLDQRSAAIVSAAARRWKWIFSLSLDGSSLRGIKESVFVKVDENGAVSIDNDYSREALWTRRPR